MKKRVALVLLALVCTPSLWAGVASNATAPGALSKEGGTCPGTDGKALTPAKAGCALAAQPEVDAIPNLEVPYELGD